MSSNLSKQQPTQQTEKQIADIFTQSMREQGEWLGNYLKGAPPEMAQFEFFLGEWNTTMRLFDPSGNVIQEGKGFWQAKTVDEGRMIVDEYHSILPTGDTMKGSITLRTFSPLTQQWEMTYLMSMRPQLATRFVARFEDGEIRATAKAVDLQGHHSIAKVRFYDITDKTFEWEQLVSWDEGDTWYKTMTISAERKK